MNDDIRSGAPEENEEFETVTLVTDEGEEVDFAHIMTFAYEGAKYAALVPEDQLDEDEPEVLFMRIDRDDEGDAYIPVDNEVLLDELFAEFVSLLDEEDGE